MKSLITVEVLSSMPIISVLEKMILIGRMSAQVPMNMSMTNNNLSTN